MDAIVAVYADWGIGAKGTQPLVIPADRRRFRALTMGAAVTWTTAAPPARGPVVQAARRQRSRSGIRRMGNYELRMMYCGEV